MATTTTTTTADSTEKGDILAALHKFARQKPGLEYGNYCFWVFGLSECTGDRAAYRAEVRAITATLHDARDLLRAVEMHAGISASDIKEGFGAFSGRLSWDGKKLDYCIGQYWPTEYRNAVCAVCASVIWSYWRDHCMPAHTLHHNSETGELLKRYNGMRADEYIRDRARLEFGRPLANRWF